MKLLVLSLFFSHLSFGAISNNWYTEDAFLDRENIYASLLRFRSEIPVTSFVSPYVTFGSDLQTPTSQISNVTASSYAFGGPGVKLNYLNIPLLLRINASDKLTLLAGPQFSILMNDDQDLVDNGQAAFKSGDVNGVAGLQLNWGSFRVYGRYVFGLSDINNIDNQDTWKNNQVQMGVGITLF